MTGKAAILQSFLRGRLGAEGRIALHEPWFAGNEKRYVLECIETGWVSSAGSFVDRFEKEVAVACGVPYAVATVNGTAALHAALLVCGVVRSDLVICPPLTFVATANAIAYCGADPVFVDIEERTLGLDPRAVSEFLERGCRVESEKVVHVATGRRVSAVLPVHIFGHPVDMAALNDIAGRWGLPVIEDATEALGSRYRGQPCGSLCQLGVLSFNGNKIITTGGGGMIVTSDEALARRLKHLTTTARIPAGWNFEHDQVGYNYRMPNLNAALGCAQIERLADFIQRKRRLAALYTREFGEHGITIFQEPAESASIYWLNALLLADARERDAFLAEVNGQGIEARPCWRLMPDLPMYAASPRAGGLLVARRMAARLVNIPSSPSLIREAVAA